MMKTKHPVQISHSPFDDWRRLASDLDLEEGLRSFVGFLILEILHDLGDLELVGGYKIWRP